jgi:3-hydroxyisobutyrate dehydrogenase-like beta-hydroxyacid dehydrogenase
MRVAVVGVGAMGLALAGHVRAAGHEVVAADIDPAARAAASAAGLDVAEGLGPVAERAEIVVVVVVTDAQSRAVTEGLLAAGMAPGSLVAIVATNHPATMVDLDRLCAARGVGFVDAPVVFGLQGARQGRLGTLCGGRDADVARLRPVAESYSRFVEHVGAVGTGQLAKTCNNMLHWAACVANYEVLLLAKRWGVDAQRMREILLQCPGKNVTLERWDTTQFTWHEKDMDVALELSQQGGLALPLMGQVDQLVKRLGPEAVRALLYGPEADYLGQRVAPLGPGEGGLA